LSHKRPRQCRRGARACVNVTSLGTLFPLTSCELRCLQRRGSSRYKVDEKSGLTVAEALWKKKPVVASAAGGIPAQVVHKHTGLLAHSVEGTAYQIRYLLAHPELAARLGAQGHEHVREEFLITSNVKRYLSLFLRLRGN